MRCWTNFCDFADQQIEFCHCFTIILHHITLSNHAQITGVITNWYQKTFYYAYYYDKLYSFHLTIFIDNLKLKSL